MSQSRAGLEASRALRRAYGHYRAYLVVKSLLALRDAVVRDAMRRKYNPNQPRVPAGNPDGGQWTDGGGSGGAGTRFPLPPGADIRLDDDEADSGERIRVAQSQNPRWSIGAIRLGNGRMANPTPGQAVRYVAARNRAASLFEEVRKRDPSWRPRPSLTETIEGEIRAREGEALEAETYLEELIRHGQGPGPYAVEAISARGPSRSFRKEEREEVNRIGREHGCHTCGTRDPGTPTGNWYLDHQLPSAVNPRQWRQMIYPQCRTCSARQGGWIRWRKQKK